LIFPIVLKDMQNYVNGNKSIDNSIIDLLEKNNISKEYLSTVLSKYNVTEDKSVDSQANFYLPPDDEGDKMIKEEYASLSPQERKNLSIRKSLIEEKFAIHLYKVEVVNAYHDIFSDDIMGYAIATSGITPTGKVTSLKKGFNSGGAFFFDEVDRVFYAGDIPKHHLIIDYGIILDNERYAKDMRAITGILVDLVYAIFTSYNPQIAIPLVNLRKEVKNLADALLNLQQNTNLIVDSIYLYSKDIPSMFSDENSSIAEFTKHYNGHKIFFPWEYNLDFRFLRD
jgi:hypothetical protein